MFAKEKNDNKAIKIGLLNGPNLNMLGKREPGIYGKFNIDDIYDSLKEIAGPAIDIVAFQSNIEGELINYIHLADEKGIDFIIFNPGAYTHTSVALRDAISSVDAKVVEVHISNVYTREEFRHISYISPVCVGKITGFGIHSYEMALYYILKELEKKEK